MTTTTPTKPASAQGVEAAAILYERHRDRCRGHYGKRIMPAWEDALPETRALYREDVAALASDATANSKAGDEDVRGALAKAVAEVEALQARVSELVRVEHRTFMDAAQINAAAGSDAARDILAERRRQIEDEGWTPEHDDEHRHGEMADAAALYASLRVRHLTGLATWPWDAKWFKPTVGNHRRDLVKAGALILAEIERIDRARTLASAEAASLSPEERESRMQSAIAAAKARPHVPQPGWAPSDDEGARDALAKAKEHIGSLEATICSQRQRLAELEHRDAEWKIALAKAVADEREACARIAEGQHGVAGVHIAADIRARTLATPETETSHG